MPAYDVVASTVYQGDLHDYIDRKGKCDAITAVKFALDIAKYDISSKHALCYILS